jgi:RNA polymerase sigma factor (sigma-70 family)
MVNGQYEAVLEPPRGLLDAKMDAEVSDGQLLSQFAAYRDELGEAAFEVLVRRHGPMVLRVCQQVVGDRHIAEDAFQATFLILARRAGSIRQPELLGHWLHGVALRTAREARMRDDRRRRRESSRAEGIEREPVDEATRPDVSLVCREEFEALHEEVSRLPDRYRAPVVLCDLEGLTYQQAAYRLRCPVGTIGVRLRRARERLRVRLTRRGLAPTAGLLGALLGAETASARVPSLLVDSTVQAAMGFAAGKVAATGLVSAPVAALIDAVLKAMALTRLKVAMGLALAIGIAGTFGWVGVRRETRILAVSGPEASRPRHEAPAPRNAAAPSQAEPQPGGTSPSPSNPAVPEPRKPQPSDAAPSPWDPAATALAGYAILNPTTGDPLEVVRTRADSLLNASAKREEEIVADSQAKEFEPESGASRLNANAVRSARDDQARGAMLFAKEWVSNDPMSHGGDGLGPIYNETSCVACHGLGAPGGAGPESKNVVLATSAPNGCGASPGLDQIFPSLGGSRSAVLHRYSTDPDYGAWRRRIIEPDGNGRQSKPASRPGEDPVASRIRAIKEQTSPDRRQRDRSPRAQSMNGININLAERNTPALFGTGRIDEIPFDVLIAAAVRQPAEVRGRLGRTREGRIGRFGWKAQIPSLHEFVRVACANELGLEVPGHSQPASPLAPTRKAKGLDLTESDCDALVSYIRALPAPVVVDPYGPQGTHDMREGRRLFTEVGCVFCHTPTLGQVRGIYSDLLLHDLGQSLSDSGSTYGIEGPETSQGPTAREWRTPPLWGYRDSGPYLHDGRAQNLEEAVALHEGQAKASAKQFFGLSAQERAQVEAFLKSLVAPSSAASPGIVLAAEMEARTEREEQRSPEAIVRQKREEAVTREVQQLRAAQRARVRLPIAQALEKMGKSTAALDSYRAIAREAPATVEGRLAAERITELTSRIVSP